MFATYTVPAFDSFTVYPHYRRQPTMLDGLYLAALEQRRQEEAYYQELAMRRRLEQERREAIRRRAEQERLAGVRRRMQIQALREQERRAAAEARRLEQIEEQQTQGEGEFTEIMKVFLSEPRSQRQQVNHNIDPSHPTSIWLMDSLVQAPRRHYCSYQTPQNQLSHSQESQDGVVMTLGDLPNSVYQEHDTAAATGKGKAKEEPIPQKQLARSQEPQDGVVMTLGELLNSVYQEYDTAPTKAIPPEPEHLDVDRQVAQQLQVRYDQEADEEVSVTLRNLLGSLGGEGVAGPSKPRAESSSPKEDVDGQGKAEEVNFAKEECLRERLYNERDEEIAETLRNIWSALAGENSSTQMPPADVKGKGKEGAVDSEIPESSKLPEDSEETTQAASKILNFYRSRRARLTSLNTIDTIRSSLHALESSFTLPAHLDFLPSAQLAYSVPNIPVHQYEHALNGLLSKLDEVESGGDGEVRARRKSVVKEVEEALETLGQRVRSVWTATQGEEAVRIPIGDGPVSVQAALVQEEPIAATSTSERAETSDAEAAQGFSVQEELGESVVPVEAPESQAAVERLEPSTVENDSHPTQNGVLSETVEEEFHHSGEQRRLPEPAVDSATTEGSSELGESEVACGLEAMESVHEIAGSTPHDEGAGLEERLVEASTGAAVEEPVSVETEETSQPEDAHSSVDTSAESLVASQEVAHQVEKTNQMETEGERPHPAEVEEVDTFLLPAYQETGTRNRKRDSASDDLVVVKEDEGRPASNERGRLGGERASDKQPTTAPRALQHEDLEQALLVTYEQQEQVFLTLVPSQLVF
ncbi:hypothetical protein NEOLEDRAFT_1150773 [Neolentinus lepideus HHB14362 ss-1]|uniref:BAG domain-containing protein n=1 Tax=Neolentinus lepideus HHB14362 ss-1 TaxID=1314782 RepID=A0A165PP82_9AGAM|nr:hypothetical protein NEOLEDRAFT_1150773 [Neolentinus lepideus HHB14362 ss-1]